MGRPSNPDAKLSDFLGPRYWLTWLGYGLVWCIARLPFNWQMAIGRGIGRLSYRLARSRRHVCETNIALCFPELSAAEQQTLVHDTFISNGIGIMEVGLAWCRNPADFRDRVTVEGLENLIRAQDQGRGVLLVSAHFSTLEFVGGLMSLFHPIDVTYRYHKNPLFDTLMRRGRQRHFGEVIERKDVRKTVRRLRQGHIVWYAADQDYGAKYSVFVDFFGVPAATITATTKFAGFNNSPVVFVAHYRSPDNTYSLHFSEALENYPTGDEHEDARRINEIIEAAIRREPAQYIWLHRRFKSRPPGMPDLYRSRDDKNSPPEGD